MLDTFRGRKYVEKLNNLDIFLEYFEHERVSNKIW